MITREEAPIYAAVAGGRLRRGHGVVPGLCNDREVLGSLANPRWLNVLAAAVIGALLGLSSLLTVTTIVPRLPRPPARSAWRTLGLVVLRCYLIAAIIVLAVRAIQVALGAG